jgi:hypothetical protein
MNLNQCFLHLAIEHQRRLPLRQTDGRYVHPERPWRWR